MMKHADIWAAIDRLAQENGLSPSGLARGAGLDPTTFNRSKRMTREGKPRWPSTESLSKILSATDTTIEGFVSLMTGNEPASSRHTAPFIRQDKLSDPDLFDAHGRPQGPIWDAIAAPAINDPHAFAMEVCGPLLEPNYRDGDILIISPAAIPRRQDRVMARDKQGKTYFGTLQRQTAKRLDIKLFNQETEISLPLYELSHVMRLMWATQ